MPTYEYRCPEGHRFDVVQKMSDAPRATCPECGSEAERMLSAGAGFLFKGEGFYITDYRSSDYRKAAQAEEKGSATASPGGEKSQTTGGAEGGGSPAKSADASGAKPSAVTPPGSASGSSGSSGASAG